MPGSKGQYPLLRLTKGQYEAHEYGTSRELKSRTYRSQCDKRMNKGTLGAPHSEDKLKFLGKDFDNAWCGHNQQNVDIIWQYKHWFPVTFDNWQYVHLYNNIKPKFTETNHFTFSQHFRSFFFIASSVVNWNHWNAYQNKVGKYKVLKCTFFSCLFELLYKYCVSISK